MVSAFPENSLYVKRLETWIGRVNDERQGRAASEFHRRAQGGAHLRGRQCGAHWRGGCGHVHRRLYANVFPESDALKLTRMPVAEQRTNGAFEYINLVWNQKGNMKYLARIVEHQTFHIYLNKKIDKPDLTGLKIRVTPVYRDFFTALGATVMHTAPGEVYTALERGVVDGYGWPIGGIFDANWHEKTNTGWTRLLRRRGVAARQPRHSWKRLDAAQRDFLTKQARALEAQRLLETYTQDETKRQQAAGIEVIRFEGAAAQQYLDRAYEAGWAGCSRPARSTGPRHTALFSEVGDLGRDPRRAVFAAWPGRVGMAPAAAWCTCWCRVSSRTQLGPCLDDEMSRRR